MPNICISAKLERAIPYRDTNSRAWGWLKFGHFQQWLAIIENGTAYYSFYYYSQTGSRICALLDVTYHIGDL